MSPWTQCYTKLLLAVLPSSGRWFLESGIQNPDGGVARYYLNAERRSLPVSTEITGYAASTFAYLYQRTGNAAYLDRARLTASFLVEKAWNPALQTFPFELAEGSPGYFFDCGIIVRGLLAVWRLTGEQRLADIALAAAQSMARDFLTPTAIHPIVALPSRVPFPYAQRWSREPGCFLLKLRELSFQAADLTFRGGEPVVRGLGELGQCRQCLGHQGGRRVGQGQREQQRVRRRAEQCRDQVNGHRAECANRAGCKRKERHRGAGQDGGVLHGRAF